MKGSVQFEILFFHTQYVENKNVFMYYYEPDLKMTYCE